MFFVNKFYKNLQEGTTGIVEGATSLSLLLVELVSPDVMYNGLPWPDEDFTKVLRTKLTLLILFRLPILLIFNSNSYLYFKIPLNFFLFRGQSTTVVS